MTTQRLATDRRSLLLGLGGLGLSGCATGGRPETRGLDRLPLAQSVLNSYVAQGRLPGAMVGVRLPEGGRAFIRAGTLDYGSFDRVDRDTLFRIYSMTKPITGAAAALLIEDGRLSLDQPVAEVIPEFADIKVASNPARSLAARPARNVMTMRHLLTHTSGLTYTFTGDGPVQRAYRKAGVFPFTGDLGRRRGDAERVRDLDEMIARLADIPLIAEPGTAYNYSVSLDVMGLVIQRVSGMAFPDFVQRRLLDPVGMRDTFWRLRPDDAGRLAAIYSYAEGGDRARFEGASADAFSGPVTLYAGGAGLISSTRDYLAFLSMLLDDGRAGRARVMQPETARLIRSDILPEGLTALGGGYGFGGWVARPGHPRAGEYGWSGAAGTQGWIDPEHGFAAVLMIQAAPYGAVKLIDELRPALDADLGITRLS